MKRHAPYANSDRPYSVAELQDIAAQRMQENSRGNSYPRRVESNLVDEGQSPQDRYATRASNQMTSHQFDEGQGLHGSRLSYQGLLPDEALGYEKQADKLPRVQPHEQDMELGYDDTPSPLTFESLEQKFLDEIMTLTKEHCDAENAENARHVEKIVEINTQYQEKLSSLRLQQAKRIEEFLRNESQARLHQYQQTLTHDRHAYAVPPVLSADASPHAARQSAPFRDPPPEFHGSGRTQEAEARVPYPSGRVYNIGARHG